ncbi:Furin-1 [Chionoecetes opilio]|uniref:Furin-1 n=1 Tax=Chionoecetes opilio TaxID=41210 RepID=A0A8J8WDU6_CHIOP|nr:Furin-1 [Chionoecetes opilio]
MIHKHSHAQHLMIHKHSHAQHLMIHKHSHAQHLMIHKHSHASVKQNPAVSYSLVRDGQPESDPSPRLDPPKYSNSHGTYCAGVVAAVANNGVCGVGVAYNASVGVSVKHNVLSLPAVWRCRGAHRGRHSDGRAGGTALSRHVEEVAVFSASWGPKDDGGHVEGPGSLARRALLYGVTAGRSGHCLRVGSGNGGVLEDNCNLDGYASSIYTLTVSALTDTGQSTFYAEPCAATLAGVFVGGQHTLEAALDKQRLQMKVVVPELDGHCSNRFQGSSAAAPLMAGVAALVLQANPNLSWRDVQHLVVAETTPTPAALTEHGWHTNARGKKFHLLQGFGAINAGRMVEAALTWHNVGPQLTENLILLVGKSKLPHGWTNVSQEVSEASPMKAVEQVVAAITLNHPKRSLLSIYIVSPSVPLQPEKKRVSNTRSITLLKQDVRGYWPKLSVPGFGMGTIVLRVQAAGRYPSL